MYVLQILHPSLENFIAIVGITIQQNGSILQEIYHMFFLTAKFILLSYFFRLHTFLTTRQSTLQVDKSSKIQEDGVS